MIPRLLPQPSELIVASLPRPLGVVLEYDERRKRATVAELIEGSTAEQQSKVGRPALAGCKLSFSTKC